MEDALVKCQKSRVLSYWALELHHRVVDDFDDDFACRGSRERPAGGAVKGRPGRLINLGPQRPLGFVVRLIRAGEIFDNAHFFIGLLLRPFVKNRLRGFFQAAADIAEIVVAKTGRAVLHEFFIEDLLLEDLIGGAGGADVGITIADVILLRHIVDYYSGNLIAEVIQRIHRHVVVYPEKYGFFFHEGCISHPSQRCRIICRSRIKSVSNPKFALPLHPLFARNCLSLCRPHPLYRPV